MNKISLLFLALLTSISNLFSQEEKTIKADIDVDNFGNIFISEYSDNDENDTLVINKDVLIHSKYAKLIGNVKLDDYKLIEYADNGLDTLYYVLNFPKRNGNEYLFNNEYLITTIEYLPISRNHFFDLKNYKLKFNGLPNNFKIVYPNENDLLKLYRSTPPLVIGDFTERISDGYFLLNFLTKDSIYISKINEIAKTLEKSHLFYSKYFGDNIKPKVVFIPFSNTLYGRTFENIILFNSKLYSVQMSDRLVAHELAHIWWGEGTLTFNEHQFTEGITEFMALEYLKSEGLTEYLQSQLNLKYYHLEGIKTLNILDNNDNFNVNEKHNLSYNIIPVVFYVKQTNDKNFINYLSEFYHKNKTKRKISVQDLISFLGTKGINELFPKDKLPDFYIIQSDKNEILIGSTSENIFNVEIECLDSNNAEKTETISISKNNPHIIKNINSLNKITIDPEYKILQVSRLNDIWDRNNNNLLDRNRYFNKSETDAKAYKFAESFILYLTSKEKLTEFLNSYEVNNINLQQVDDFISNNFNHVKNLITGASVYYNTKNGRLDIKLALLDNKIKETDVVVVRFFFSRDFNKINKISIQENVNEEDNNDES